MEVVLDDTPQLNVFPLSYRFREGIGASRAGDLPRRSLYSLWQKSEPVGTGSEPKASSPR
jgi:hypothetical protein